MIMMGAVDRSAAV
jgi:hypothetical protein